MKTYLKNYIFMLIEGANDKSKTMKQQFLSLFLSFLYLNKCSL